jgi:hypothetical protein
MAMSGVIPVWIALLALGMLVAVFLWAKQRDVALQASEARASQAESRAATAEALVTAQADIESATATALAYVNSPAAAVDRSLNLVLATEQDPTDQRLRALTDALGPPALTVIRPEVEHLLSGGLHLGGVSAYDLTVLAVNYPSDAEAQVHTLEHWTYDERSADDQRSRCLIETSDQTYSLQKAGPDWQVTDIELATSSRTDCPNT